MALRAGASGFLLKTVKPDDLLAAICTVASGDAVVSPRITRRLLETFAHQLPAAGDTTATKDHRIAMLTARELEVLVEVAQGYSNAKITERLFLSESTIKTHVGRILPKLGPRTRVEAVVFAYETGLVRPQ
ncbi:LuxR C-terminal-related transcriptional regulator [Streptomyces inhibens]|uniref:LuxR C-terminal-related transcriptional regulator n=1 Tax=Streptomyces inhibens TaxID=2293571 RepID=UPI0037AB5CAA